MFYQRYREKILMSFLAITFWNFSVALIYGVTHHADTLKTDNSLSYQAHTSQALWPQQLANLLLEPVGYTVVITTASTALNYLGDELSPQFTNSAHLHFHAKRVRLAAAMIALKH